MVQITSAMSIAKMVGSNRVVLGNGIIHVTGDAKLAPEEEKALRRKLVSKGRRGDSSTCWLLKVRGEPFESEMLPTSFESIPMPCRDPRPIKSQR